MDEMIKNEAVSEKKVALAVKNVNKTIGKRQILHDISFEAYEGEVFGFLGPNGAGKTTTIKMIVGLLSVDDGEIEVDGYDVGKDFEKALANVGGIVENPELYKYLTGRENLEQYARMRDGVKKERIDEVATIVGLSKRIDEKVKQYSLGMRQRLGVAQAILHHPKVLILDEPTNGLDPAGIKELRDIFKKLAHEEKICIMVSSHLMSEMELMCDRVGIISGGKMVGEYTVEEMVNANQSGKREMIYEVSDIGKATGLINSLNLRSEVRDSEHIDVVFDEENAKENIANLTKVLIEGGVSVYSVSYKENKKLEDAFIELTNSGGVQID